jgi:hypothetical protein
MPYSKQHKDKKQKNLALLLILLGVVALFFTITIVKIKTGL